MKNVKVEICIHRADLPETLVRWVSAPSDVNYFWLQTQLPEPEMANDIDVYIDGERWDVLQNYDLPSLVRSERKKLGLTQCEFAKKLAVSGTTASNWETGKSPVPSNMFALIAFLKNH